MIINIKPEIPTYLVLREMYSQEFLELKTLVDGTKNIKTLSTYLNKKRKMGWTYLDKDGVWYYTEDFDVLPTEMCE